MKRVLPILILSALLISRTLSAQFNLTLNFVNMDPHVGQRFEIRVTDRSDSTEVGRQVIKEIIADSFTVELFVLLSKHNYNVDFYADLNGNGMYDAPPADHAWRVEIDNVIQDVVVNFSHNTNFTDIEIPGSYDFSFYEATWGGKWMNLTFGSTDTIQSSVQVNCDSFHISSVTSGLFGIPDTVVFELADTVPDNFDPACDSLSVELTTPLMGELILFNGMMTGNFVEQGTGIGLRFTGNYGAGQQLFGYTVLNNGVPFANGFSYARELVVHAQIPALQVEIDTLIDVSCAGMHNGEVTLAVQGGVEPIEIDWCDGGIGLSRTDLPAGQYCVTVTDVNGCEDALDFVITEPEILKVSVITQIDVLCYGGSDGVLEVTVTGGCAPYLFSIDGGINFIAVNIFTGLQAGDYVVAVVDAKGCISDVTVTIGQPDELLPLAVSTDETAAGANDGTASSSPIGGTPPYSILWSTGDTTAAIAGLSPGGYTVTVVDANGCSATQSVDIAPFGCSLTVVIEGMDVICPGEVTTLVAVASDEPVIYEWMSDSVIATGPSVEVIAGTYTVIVTDEFGCSDADTFVVNEFASISIDSIIVVNEAGGNGEGAIRVVLSGGQPPFVYSWTKDGVIYSSDKDLMNLSAGSYCLQITDSNGCSFKTDTIVVDNTSSLVDPVEHFQIFPNPAIDFINIKAEFLWSMQMVDSQGRDVRSVYSGSEEKIDLQGLSSGVYFLILSDGERTLTKRVVVQR